LAKRLAETGAALEASTPTMALAGALQRQFVFVPLIEAGDAAMPPKRRIMLIGPPGSGKTIATAKLATQAAMDKDIIGIVSTDTRRAGGMEQLAAFARILELPMAEAKDADDLCKLLKRMGDDISVLIDTPGTNPFDDAEMGHLKLLIEAAAMETVLVMAAGGDAYESAEIAARFAAIGAKRLLVTRIDVSRRLGSILAAADAGGLILSEISMSANVAEGIDPIRPKTLARTIMPYSDGNSSQEHYKGSAPMTSPPTMTEAAS